ncbi:hypothetical protein [Paenibacillus sp. Y412MC10]|uniref:hypothetical protein n=1 Tax=Geobacillus sp. (strain Y412MC10) TaxID=481743 RepID=UPI0011AB618C|nr:hypothetical protein [Paenibacillus sp. Y412MC10]
MSPSSMITISAIILLIIAGFFLFRAMKRKKRIVEARRIEEEANKPFEEPALLGIQPDMPVREAILFLEKAFDDYYGDMLKDRAIRKFGWTEEAYRITVFELKRYFLIHALLKSTPLRGERPYLLWKEMTLLKERYEGFIRAISGRLRPEGPDESENHYLHQQAMFDWFYCTLFVPTRFSHSEWGGFHQHSFDPELLYHYKAVGHNTLTLMLFSMEGINHTHEFEQLSVHLMSRFRKHLHYAAALGTDAAGTKDFIELLEKLEGKDVFSSVYTAYWSGSRAPKDESAAAAQTDQAVRPLKKKKFVRKIRL